jgi:hypothetical protein
MIFPRLPLHLMEFEGIWGQYLQLEVNKNGLRGFFKKTIFFLRALLTTPHGSFCGRLQVPARSHPSPGRPCGQPEFKTQRYN